MRKGALPAMRHGWITRTPDPMTHDDGLRRAIGPVGFGASVINIVVGGSVFVMPAVLARELGQAAPSAYLAGAAIMALVTLSFAEAGRRTVRSGGPYVFVGSVFGPFPGYLAGLLTWLAVVCATAAVAAALVDSLGTVVSLLTVPVARAAVLVLLFIALAAVNLRGVQAGTRLATATAIAKYLGLLVFIVLGARLVQAEHVAWAWPEDAAGLGRATIFVTFALAGMEVPLSAGGEIRDPARTVPRGLAGALVLVVLLYVAVQLVAQGALGPAVSESKAPLADALARVGRGGSALMLATGAISMLGYLVGSILGNSRVLFAFGRDGVLPRRLAAVHPGTQAPHVAVLVHTAIAAALSMTGTFSVLAPVAGIAIILAYIGCCAAGWKAGRRPEPDGVSSGSRLGTIAPPLAIVAMVWVLTQSTRREVLALLAVLVLGSAFWWFRMKAQGGAGVRAVE
ncbi:MAG: APC family permease [Gemmatimonadales bacterium]